MRRIIARILEKPLTSYLLLVIILSIMMAPIIFTALTSFKTRAETFRWPPSYFPKKLTLEAYREVFFRSPIARHLLNSLIIAIGTTTIVMIGGLFTAFGVSQYKFKGSKTVLLIFIATRIIPPISLLVPFYIIMSFLHLINTYACLMIVNTFLWYPFAIWMLKSFFDKFPRELIDSAIVDGCTRTSAFFKDRDSHFRYRDSFCGHNNLSLDVERISIRHYIFKHPCNTTRNGRRSLFRGR